MDALIDRYLAENRLEMVAAAQALVAIPSVRTEPEGPWPYGAACARALDFCEVLARKKGLQVENGSYRWLTASLPGGERGRHVLFAAHADVVPADGEGAYSPYGGQVDKGYIIGRGAVDDKVPLIAVLYALAFFRKHRFSMRDCFSLFIGSNEEFGMDDVDDYLARKGQPDLALVADDDFPVARGERGLLRFTVTGQLAPCIRGVSVDKRRQHLLPERCAVTLGRDGGEEQWTFPREGGSPLVELLYALYRAGLRLFDGGEADTALLKLASTACRSCIFDEADGGADAFLTDLRTDGAGTARMEVRLYFDGALEGVRDKVFTLLEGTGLTVAVEHASPSHILPAEDPVVRRLTELYNRCSRTSYAPYVMPRGITYARKFRYGFGFGAGDPAERKPFPRGFGASHGPDEAHSIDTMLHAVRIYIKAIWELESRGWTTREEM